MTPPPLTDEDRRALLQDIAAIPTAAEDSDDLGHILHTFLPMPEHAQLLQDRTILVRGDRGAGKTTLFLVLRAAAERSIPLQGLFGANAGAPAQWVEGFSEVGSRHPFVDVLTGLADGRTDATLRAFWLGYLAGVLSDASLVTLPDVFSERWRLHRNDPRQWVDAALLTLGPLSAALDEAEGRLGASGKKVIVTYDNLDRLPLADSARRYKYASVLIDLWMSLSNRYRHLRPKIFLREDIYRATKADWPDASKVEARSVRLSWSASDLHRLIARHLAGASPALREWLVRYARVDV